MQQYHEQEVGHAVEKAVRPDQSATFFVNLASTSALDPALNLGEPASPSADALRLARRYCGRWLALRQLHLGLSNQEIAERTGVDAQTLLALELGLPEARCLTDNAAEQLCGVLTDARDDADFVAAVIDVARGREDDREGVIMERVMADLQPTLDSPEAD
jgi:transcriptional regulator with XRE-family HTH domain